MKLWTIQTIEAYEKFKCSGILSVDKEFIYEDFDFHYNWMVNEMKKRIGVSLYSDGQYPIWAWYQWFDEKCKRPDLRYSGHLEKGKRGVLLELEVDEKEVLLSDFSGFNQVLNYGYISDNEDDYDKFYNKLKMYGYDHYDLQHIEVKCDILDKLKSELYTSWEKIFELDREVCEEWSGNIESIQATMWQVGWEQVVSIKHFIAK